MILSCDSHSFSQPKSGAIHSFNLASVTFYTMPGFLTDSTVPRVATLSAHSHLFLPLSLPCSLSQGQLAVMVSLTG